METGKLERGTGLKAKWINLIWDILCLRSQQDIQVEISKRQKVDMKTKGYIEIRCADMGVIYKGMIIEATRAGKIIQDQTTEKGTKDRTFRDTHTRGLE